MNACNAWNSVKNKLKTIVHCLFYQLFATKPSKQAWYSMKVIFPKGEEPDEVLIEKQKSRWRL